MDPDETLRQLREVQYRIDGFNDAGEPELMAEWRRLAERAAELFAALDDWLTRGGFPPKQWTGPGVGIPPGLEDD